MKLKFNALWQAKYNETDLTLIAIFIDDALNRVLLICFFFLLMPTGAEHSKFQRANIYPIC